MSLLLSLVLSGFFLAAVFYSARSNGLACLYAVGAAVASLFLCQSLVLFFNAVLVAIVLFGCFCTSASRAKAIKASLGATAAAYALMNVFIYQSYQRDADARDREPLASLEPRLAYESRPRVPVQLTPEAQSELRLLENQLSMVKTPEAERLRELHQGYVLHFINSPGFGVVRTLGRNANSAFGTVGASLGTTIGVGLFGPFISPAPESNAEKLPQDYEEPALLGKFTSPWPQAGDRVPPQTAFLSLNRGSTLDFADPRTFGYVRNRRQVAGFAAHRLRSIPRLNEAPAWQVVRLDLVSLLKHPEPVAYDSEELPRMDKLQHAPVRALDVVEKQMLAELQRGADVEVRVADDRLRMLGAIRAAEQCLRCHEVKRGDLLGAFAYRMKRGN